MQRLSRSLAAALLILALSLPAWAQGIGGGQSGSGGMATNGSNGLAVALATLGGSATIADNATLATTATASYTKGVWRKDYASGNGAPPMFFLSQTGLCAANNYPGTATPMVNDGGYCQNSTDGNSWVAQPASDLDWREFGVVASASDDQTSIQNAFNAGSRLGRKILICGPGTYKTSVVYGYQTPIEWCDHQAVLQRINVGPVLVMVDAVGHTFPTVEMTKMYLMRPTIDMNTTLVSTAGGAGIVVSGVNNWYIYDPIIYNIPSNTSTAPATTSVNAGTATVTTSVASPGVVTWTNHGLAPGTAVKFSAAGGSLPTGITAGTTYYVIAAGIAANTFEISATQGGAAINTTGTSTGTQTGTAFAPVGTWAWTEAVGTGWASNAGIAFLGSSAANVENGTLYGGFVGNFIFPGQAACTATKGAAGVLLSVPSQLIGVTQVPNPPNANLIYNTLADCNTIGFRGDYETADRFVITDSTWSGTMGIAIGSYGRYDVKLTGTPSGSSTVGAIFSGGPALAGSPLTIEYTGTGSLVTAAATWASQINASAAMAAIGVTASVYPGTSTVAIHYGDEVSVPNTTDPPLNIQLCGSNTSPSCAGVIAASQFYINGWDQLSQNSSENSGTGAVYIGGNVRAFVLDNPQQISVTPAMVVAQHGGIDGSTNPQVTNNHGLNIKQPGTQKTASFTTNCNNEPQPYMVNSPPGGLTITMSGSELPGTKCTFIDDGNTWQTRPVTIQADAASWGAYTVLGSASIICSTTDATVSLILDFTGFAGAGLWQGGGTGCPSAETVVMKQLYAGAPLPANAGFFVGNGVSVGMYTGEIIGWSAAGADAALDTGLSRDAAGVVDVGTGAAKSVAGSLKSAWIGLLGTTLPTQAAGTLGIGGNATTPTTAANGEGDIWLLSTTGGLALQGKGSVNDITINNSGGSAVITIPTGALGTKFAGSISPTLSAAAGANQVCTGTSGTAFTTVASGTACASSAMRYKIPQGSLVAGDGLQKLVASPFRYKDSERFGERVHVGLYADDVQKMDPRCVVFDKDGKLENYEDRCVLAYAIATIQQQQAEIDKLRDR